MCRKLGGIDGLEVGPQSLGGEAVEALPEKLIDELVVEPGLQVRHCAIVAHVARARGDR